MWAVVAFLIDLAIQTAIYAGIAYGIAYLLREEPKTKAPGKVKYELPTAEEGRPFPVIFGKKRIRGLNAISNVFDKEYERIESGTYGAATLYHVGFHLGVCQANIDGIKQVWFGESLVWPYPKQYTREAADGNTGGDIGADEIWGGWAYGGGGGVDGNFDVQYGEDTQDLQYVLEDKLGSNQPAYRGFTGLVFYQPYIGTAPYIRPVSVVAKRTDLLTDGSEMWYLAKANVDPDGNDDLNAIHMVYELTTSTIIGRGIDTSLIGDSFETAADTCYSEGYGLSCVWDYAEDDIATMIEQVERIVDGKLYYDMDTEKYEFGLNRGDYDADSLEEFGPDDFWMESAGYISAGRIPNKVIVIWEDRRYNQRRMAYDDDIAIYARQNYDSYIKEQDFSNFVCRGSLANKIASRDQYALSSMPKRFTLRCLRTMAHLHETDVFKISYPALNIASMIVRIVTIDLGSLDDNEVIIECIEDVFGQSYTIYGNPPDQAVEEEEEGNWPDVFSNGIWIYDEIGMQDEGVINPYIEAYDSIGLQDYANISIA